MNDGQNIQNTTGNSIARSGKAAQYLSYINPFHFKKHGTHARAVIALVMVCFFWGTTWLASKEGVRYMPALQLAGIRQLLGGLCYLLFFMYKKAPLPKGREWGIILMLAFLNFTLSNALSTWGIKFVSAGLGSIISAIFPLWLVVIGLLGGKTKIPARAIVGLLLGFGGICVVFYEHLPDFLIPDFRFGILLSIASTWSWAIGILYTKKHATGFNPYYSLGFQMFFSGLALVLFTNISGMAIPVTAIPWQSWSAIAYLVTFGSVLSFGAFLYALQNLPTEQVSIYAYINPVVAVLLGWLLLGEMLTVFIVSGVVLTLLGVYLVNKAVKLK